ncbi:MAG: hypothetical protein WCI73_16570 [Phycisphaerae bacterium]
MPDSTRSPSIGHARIGPLTVTALLMGLGVSMLGACQRNLFVDTDPAANKAERYFESDSAVKTREARKQGDQIGFGYSNGAAPQ